MKCVTIHDALALGACPRGVAEYLDIHHLDWWCPADRLPWIDVDYDPLGRDGDGHGGYGDGNVDGCGTGYGDELLDGTGYGSGYGYGLGRGDGDGRGYGSGTGYGDGDGDGYGHGHGYGDGCASDYDCGNGRGAGYGDGLDCGGYGYGDHDGGMGVL